MHRNGIDGHFCVQRHAGRERSGCEEDSEGNDGHCGGTEQERRGECAGREEDASIERERERESWDFFTLTVTNSGAVDQQRSLIAHQIREERTYCQILCDV